MLEQLASGAKLVGWKQSRRALDEGLAKKVFLALDAEPGMQEEILSCCETAGVEVLHVPTMKELGKACGIQVGAAVATLL